MAKVTISLDADLAIEGMLPAGTRSPQGDAVDTDRLADRRSAPEEGR